MPPTYEYSCRRCGHRFERFQAITEKPVRTCPKCRGRVDRLPGTGAALLFKGSGFYATDYRSPEYHKAAKSEKEASGATSAEPSAKEPSKKSESK